MGYGYYTRTIDGLERHLGYGVLCLCDHPDCTEEIDRGLSYVCGGEPGEDNEYGCGRYFCGYHLRNRTYGRGKHATTVSVCDQCKRGRKPWPMKPDPPNALANIVWHKPADEVEAEALSAKSRLAPFGQPAVGGAA